MVVVRVVMVLRPPSVRGVVVRAQVVVVVVVVLIYMVHLLGRFHPPSIWMDHRAGSEGRRLHMGNRVVGLVVVVVPRMTQRPKVVVMAVMAQSVLYGVPVDHSHPRMWVNLPH
jgi:hypothetical protein